MAALLDSSMNKLNIDKLETDVDSAPFGGTTLFQMSARVTSNDPFCLARSYGSRSKMTRSFTS